jgi:hypothetical protein
VPLRLAPATVGAFYLRKTAGNLAIFAAIRRASSRVSKWSQSRPSFSNVRYSAARPMIALFFFESETAGLMFVGNCCLQALHG